MITTALQFPKASAAFCAERERYIHQHNNATVRRTCMSLSMNCELWTELNFGRLVASFNVYVRTSVTTGSWKSVLDCRHHLSMQFLLSSSLSSPWRDAENPQRVLRKGGQPESSQQLPPWRDIGTRLYRPPWGACCIYDVGTAVGNRVRQEMRAQSSSHLFAPSRFRSQLQPQSVSCNCLLASVVLLGLRVVNTCSGSFTLELQLRSQVH